MSTPPSKDEMDRLNAKIRDLHRPKGPQMQLTPGGAMARSAQAVNRQVATEEMKKLTERRDQIAQRLGQTKDKARDDFER